MLANLLAGIVAWRIARKKHYEAPWVTGVLATLAPIAGLWVALVPPEDDHRGQE